MICKQIFLLKDANHQYRILKEALIVCWLERRISYLSGYTYIYISKNNAIELKKQFTGCRH